MKGTENWSRTMAALTLASRTLTIASPNELQRAALADAQSLFPGAPSAVVKDAAADFLSDVFINFPDVSRENLMAARQAARSLDSYEVNGFRS